MPSNDLDVHDLCAVAAYSIGKTWRQGSVKVPEAQIQGTTGAGGRVCRRIRVWIIRRLGRSGLH